MAKDNKIVCKSIEKYNAYETTATVTAVKR
jgi:hypothetical protein